MAPGCDPSGVVGVLGAICFPAVSALNRRLIAGIPPGKRHGFEPGRVRSY